MKIPCTVGILTKNSGKTLRRALESVKDFDEIIINDGGSSDDTLKIAQEFGAKIIIQDKSYLDESGYIQDFSAARNQLVKEAKYDWYFYIDSDEEATAELVAAVKRVVSTRSEGAFNVSRRYILAGKEVECCTSYPNHSMRLFSKKSSSGFRKIVHERPDLNSGVHSEMLEGTLRVPVETDRANVRRRNDRYIALEVKRKGYVGIMRFFGYSWWHLRASLIYVIRLAQNYVTCRGVRLPLSMELDRHSYHLRLMSAIWRARKYTYPPNVVFMINKWKTGGSEHVMVQEFEAFKKEGITARFCVVYGNEFPATVLPNERLAPHFTGLFDVAAYVRLLTRFGEEGVTHIIATLEHAMVVARLAAIFAPKVRVVIMESGMADRKPVRFKLLDLLLNWRVSRIIAGSSGVSGSLSYQMPYRSKIDVLLNGVSVPNSLPKRQEPARFTFLAVGSFRTEKAFDVLLNAFSSFLQSAEVNAELLIAGRGVLEADLKQQVAHLGIESNVRFLGQVSHTEVLSLCIQAHCFVLSSSSEGNPTVVMEAMAHGLPVIATRVSGVGDYIEDGRSGLLVPIGDANAISDAMGRIYKDEQLRERLSTEGYAVAQKKLSFEQHVAGLKSALGI